MTSNTETKSTVKFTEIISGGRLTIPNEQRTKMNLSPGDTVKVWIEDEQIRIEKVAV